MWSRRLCYLNTRTEQFLGSIRYAHPEYLTGENCGKESDAYSVGAVAYELLFGERFLGAETNWARLVARVVGWRSPSPTDVGAQCERLARTHSHETAEAAYWLLRHLLWDPTDESIDQLVAAIDQQFWKTPFHEDEDGTVHLGAPTLVEWAEDPDALKRELPWAWDRTARTTDGDGLHEVLRSRYWEWRCQLDDLDQLEDLPEIEGDLGFFFDMADVGNDVVAFADTLLILYRYRRLPDFSV